MHPRNIYKNPPNFKHLAISYPEFRKFTKQVIDSKHKYVDNLLTRFLCVSAMQCGDRAFLSLSLNFRKRHPRCVCNTDKQEKNSLYI